MTRSTSNSKLIRLMVAYSFGFLLTGCTARIADLTFVSTKNIDLTNTHLDARSGQRYTGQDCGYAVLGIPFSWPNLEEAVDRALEKGNGNVMVDQVTEVKGTWFILGTQTCFNVEGTVLTAPSTSKAKAAQ